MTAPHSLSIILLAGGKGSRLGTKEPKQFLKLNRRPIARYSFDLFLSLPIPTEELIVVCSEEFVSLFDNPIKKIRFAKPGQERHLSLLSGFNALTKEVDFVIIHDAARPFLELKELLLLFEEGKKTGAATLACPVTSTIKQSDCNNLVTSTLTRHSLWEAQTPQLLKYSLLQQGLEKLVKENLSITDDVALAELLHHPVKLIKGSPMNFKITTIKDLRLAQTLVNGEFFS